MLPIEFQPRIVTTLHGTDTMLLGSDPGYMPAIRHALSCSDAVTAVSDFLQQETERLLEVDHPIEVIHNFFAPRPLSRSREEIRRELGITDELLLFHSSNLRSVKRIDLLLQSMSRVRPRNSFKLLILAGEDFTPFADEVQRLGLADRVLVRDQSCGNRRLSPSRRPGTFTRRNWRASG